MKKARSGEKRGEGKRGEGKRGEGKRGEGKKGEVKKGGGKKEEGKQGSLLNFFGWKNGAPPSSKGKQAEPKEKNAKTTGAGPICLENDCVVTVIIDGDADSNGEKVELKRTSSNGRDILAEKNTSKKTTSATLNKGWGSLARGKGKAEGSGQSQRKKRKIQGMRSDEEGKFHYGDLPPVHVGRDLPAEPGGVGEISFWESAAGSEANRNENGALQYGCRAFLDVETSSQQRKGHQKNSGVAIKRDATLSESVSSVLKLKSPKAKERHEQFFPGSVPESWDPSTMEHLRHLGAEHLPKLGSYYAERVRSSGTSELWTSIMKPRRVTDLCGNKGDLIELKKWLYEWQERIQKLEKEEMGGEQHSDSDSDFQTYGETGGSSFHTRNNAMSSFNAMLITGATGIGKTAAVYACAEELGFEIVEMNASDRRTGSLLMSTVGEAAQSGTLRNKAGAVQMLGGKANGSSSHDDAQGCSLRLSLILLDEIDTVCDNDKGFAGALSTILRSTRRPIILTASSDFPSCLPSGFNGRHLHFRPPPADVAGIHAAMVASACGCEISCERTAYLAQIHQGDIRRLLNQTQLIAQTSTPPRDQPSSSLSRSRETDELQVLLSHALSSKQMSAVAHICLSQAFVDKASEEVLPLRDVSNSEEFTGFKALESVPAILQQLRQVAEIAGHICESDTLMGSDGETRDFTFSVEKIASSIAGETCMADLCRSLGSSEVSHLTSTALLLSSERACGYMRANCADGRNSDSCPHSWDNLASKYIASNQCIQALSSGYHTRPNGKRWETVAAMAQMQRAHDKYQSRGGRRKFTSNLFNDDVARFIREVGNFKS